MFKKIFIPILALCQLAYSEITFINIFGKPDLVISLSKGKLQNILQECKEFAQKKYKLKGEYRVRVFQGVQEGDFYFSIQTGKRYYFTKDEPNQVFIVIIPATKGMKGGVVGYFLDKTNTSIEGYKVMK